MDTIRSAVLTTINAAITAEAIANVTVAAVDLRTTDRALGEEYDRTPVGTEAVIALGSLRMADLKQLVFGTVRHELELDVILVYRSTEALGDAEQTFLDLTQKLHNQKFGLTSTVFDSEVIEATELADVPGTKSPHKYRIATLRIIMYLPATQ